MSPVLLVFVFFTAFGSAFGCGGGGCSCMAPIPGGFPSEARIENAAQIRVTDTGLAAITDDPAALVSGLTGGPLQFDIPASCGGTPELCCAGGTPMSPCGPLVIDLVEQEGDEPRLTITPFQGESRLHVTLYARIHTMTGIPVGLPGADCTLDIDSEPGADPDIRVDMDLNFVIDQISNTTRVETSDPEITQLDVGDDIDLWGTGFNAITCAGYGGLLGLAEDTLLGTFTDAIKGAIDDQLCKACPGGTVEECGEFADACTDNVCMRADETCVQELGVTGRMAGAAIFGALSPGTTGSIDLYEVAGEYANTDSGGISLGLLGGMLPSGTEHDRCGPPATAPAAATIPESDFFKGNTRPDRSPPDDTFDVGIGVHQSQLDAFAYSAYDGGLFCLTIGTSTVDLLTSETIGLFIPSLANLTGRPSPMYLGLRPQSPPVIVLGTNTFLDDGAGNVTLDDPLLDITFTGLEMDFFVGVEDQFIRIMTIVADVHLPLGLQVGDGEITPVLGDLEAAFTNLTVKNNEVLVESAEELADVFPTLLDLALPQIAGGLGGFAVPELAGLQLNITDITAVDNVSFLAIFAELAPAMKRTARVETVAQLLDVRYPGTDVMVEPTRWSRDTRPQIDLALGDDAGLEYQTRIGSDGLWSPWSTAKRRTLSQDRLWLEGKHVVEVRARRIGQPHTVDRTPARLEAIIDTIAPTVALAWDPAGVRLDGTDNVAAPLTARWRFGDDAWTDVEVPAVIPKQGAWDDLEVELYDAVGNMSPARGVSMAPAPFHGAPSEGGCGCASSQGGAGTGALVLVIGGLFAIGRRRLRRLRKLLIAVAFVVAAASLPACDCGGNPCGDVACLPGAVEMGTIGRYNGIASDGTRTVVSTYDETLGDLVLVDVLDGEPVYEAVDGVPDETPSYDPSTYRGGRVNLGPDVGTWSSVALHDGLARLASQDVDAGDLRVAIEQQGGQWLTYSVDAQPDVVTGTHTSIAIDGDGAPAVAYLATGVAGDDGTVSTELRLARANNADPGDGDWAITTIASGVGSCAGLCASGTCVEPAADGEPEVCATDSGDCTAACGDGETCVAGACRANVADPTAADLPHGTGLFVNLLALSSGRLALVYYDRARTALVAQVETGAGSSTFTEVVLDGADDADRGLWASAAAAADGTIHIAYQDGRTDQVFYTTLGNTQGPIELVDDGLRAPDRPHNVGAGAAVFVSGTTPSVIYQDGFTSDLVKSTRSQAGTWARSDFATGANLIDGFYLAATPDGSHLAWDAMDKNRSPAGALEIREDP